VKKTFQVLHSRWALGLAHKYKTTLEMRHDTQHNEIQHKDTQHN
jgi:hypothetical protein